MQKAHEALGGGQNINVTVQNGVNPVDSGNGSSGEEKTGSSIRSGAWAVTKKYGGATLKAVPSGALKTLTTATGAMFGFAGGVAKGDITEALKGAAGGGTIGAGLVNGGIKLASNIQDNVKNLVNDIQDTYNEGAYGSEYAKNMKMVKAYKQTSDYKELKNIYKDKLTDEKLIEILNAAKKETKK